MVTPKAAAFVQEVTGDGKQTVVMFALEWCEFCWSVRRMFAVYKIPYRTVDLDSVAYQQDDWGGQIRTALAARTTWKTIPQIFIANEFVGGANFDRLLVGSARSLGRDGLHFSGHLAQRKLAEVDFGARVVDVDADEIAASVVIEHHAF